MAKIPEEFHDLFEKRTFAHLATVLPDGTPHSVPVWVDYDPESNRLLVNTDRESRKARNAAETPQVSVSMTDPDEPYRFLAVRGEVVEMTSEGAVEHANELARRYMGVEEYPNLDEYEEPVVLKIRPDRIAPESG